MTRMIERWFPCKEVSENSASGWGSGNAERSLYTWFAARPSAQAKAAVICSLLEWPDDEVEQRRLQSLVRTAMTGRYAAWEELRSEIARANPDGASVLDPFSGRGMIPLEAARLGVPSIAFEYAPVAVMATSLLTDFPFRDWNREAQLPFKSRDANVGTIEGINSPGQRLLHDVKVVLEEVGRRHVISMRPFFPSVGEVDTWGYLWGVSIPCQECGNRFPLVGSYELIRARAGHEAQSFYVSEGDGDTFGIVLHAGSPSRKPTLSNAVLPDGRKAKGKSAVCVFCNHVHTLEAHRRLVNEGFGRDEMLLACDIDEIRGKRFRLPEVIEVEAARHASEVLTDEPPFSPLLPAIPAEEIRPGNNNIIGPSIYGARTFGDFMVDRQTLSYVRLTRIISDIGTELEGAGLSDAYARALVGYATAVVTKKLRRSTRGARFQAAGGAQVGDLFVNEGSITFSHDFFEAGIGKGPGTWDSICRNVLSVLRGLTDESRGRPTTVERGTATRLGLPSSSISAVVTDPPYDSMIAYSDASDLFYSWMKRAAFRQFPELAITDDPYGAQNKTLEIIVKRQEGTGKLVVKDHRTKPHYDNLIRQAFKEMQRVVRDDGVVTIVFGHGDPEVWGRLLGAITGAGLVMTGSWPARTEKGGSHGNAHIETTLTMACRPAAENRPVGLKAQVEAAVRAEVKSRVSMWESSGLAPTDMLMASAGPAMEVVGRFDKVADIRGEAVDAADFLVIARRAVQEASRIEIDHHPLDTFDARTRFALWWLQLFGKSETAKSELRWQTLASDLDLASVRDLVVDTKKGVRFTDASTAVRRGGQVDEESAVIDVALAMCAAWPEGLVKIGEVLAAAGRDDDPFLWAVLGFLSDRLPDADPDAVAANKILRNRQGVSGAAKGVLAQEADEIAASKQQEIAYEQS